MPTPEQIVAWRKWVWPLPKWKGRTPYITDGFYPAKTVTHRQHLGVDVMYPQKPGDPPFPRSTGQSAVPKGVPVLAAYEGKVWNAGQDNRGHHVTIDHGDVPGIGPAVTFYQHLASLDKPYQKGDAISTGQVLGPVGGDLPPNYTLTHLHFELKLYSVPSPVATHQVNPMDVMGYWRFISMGGLPPLAIVAGIAGLFGGILLYLNHQEESDNDELLQARTSGALALR